jgi:hypothetical protein
MTLQTNIMFEKRPVPVNLIGTDQKLLPSLIAALRNNKITLQVLTSSVERIDLFSAEAMIYSSNGNKARIPIF